MGGGFALTFLLPGTSPRCLLHTLKVFHGDTPTEGCTNGQVIPTWINNRCNGFALNKLMTTCYLANAVVMELSVYLNTMGTQALVEWTPELGTAKQMPLAEEVIDGFDPKL